MVEFRVKGSGQGEDKTLGLGSTDADLVVGRLAVLSGGVGLGTRNHIDLGGT